MADELQFIENGIQRSQINEFFADELGRAGYGGMELAKTPMGTQIVLKAEKPGMVIGKGGKNIRKITTTLEEEFHLEDPQIDVQEVEEPDLNAQIVADRLANALERGWYFRKAGHTTLERIIDAGALGAEIVLSGKVTGARGRVEKFTDGYIKHNGEPAEEIVDRGKSVAVMKLGTIGVNVKIIPPGADLPDDFQIREDVDLGEMAGSSDSEDVDELIEEPTPADEEPATAVPDDPDVPGSPEDAGQPEEVIEEASVPEEPAVDAETESPESDATEEEPEPLDADVEAEAQAIVEEMEATDEEDN